MGGFILLPGAKADIRRIWKTSYFQWGRTQADRYIAEMEACFRAIAENSKLGRACDEIRAGYFRVRSGSHIIFYHRDGASITVVRILHKRQDFKRHLKLTPPPQS